MFRLRSSLSAAALVACAGAPAATRPDIVSKSVEEPPVTTRAVSLADVGLDGAALDRSVQPCDDFYAFACGTWLKNTAIPSDRSTWGRSFSEIDRQNDETLREILESASASDDAQLRKLGAFYGACMDEAGIEAAGLKPVEGLLAGIKGVKDLKSLQTALLALHEVRITVPFHVGAEQDMKDATRVIFGIDQGGLGLPDRDYYVKDDEKSKALRTTYLAHVERMLVLLGQPKAEAKKGAAGVMALETALAKASKTRVERRDPTALYNKIDRAGVTKAAPDFPWDAYFERLGRPDLKDINVSSVAFLEGMNKQLKTGKSAAWRAYLAYHVAVSMAEQLPKAFSDERFALAKALTGQKEIEARWKRCVAATDGALGELLAQPFVARKFGGDSKAMTERMVKEISAAFGRGLSKLEWMDEPTRERARQKLATFHPLIGYPSKWKSYDWEVGPSYAANTLASRKYEFVRDLGDIGRPVDREKWEMTPPTVNAYYNPQKNEMVFPAGILQPPFYDPKASLAVNMGAIGMVVGHELTHGFDDEGSQFASDGNMENWWEPETRARFEAKTQCIEGQYEKYEPLPGVHLNGKLTMGENIADNGGVKLAFEAWVSMRAAAAERLVADTFTEEQQFFLAVAQSWCTNATEDALRLRAATDPHSPPRFRVNGSLSNQPAFWEAFSCEPGTKMRPADACSVW